MLLKRFLFLALCAVGLVTLRRRRRQLVTRQLKLSKDIDIGGFFGLDIGAALAKLAFFEPEDPVFGRHGGAGKGSEAAEALREIREFVLSRRPLDPSSSSSYGRDARLTLRSEALQGTFHFLRFESRKMEEMLERVASSKLHRNVMTLFSTGRETSKYRQKFKDDLGIILEKLDDLDCLIMGLNFALKSVVNECYALTQVELSRIGVVKATKVYRQINRSPFPYLLVNIGAGVSILQVDSETSYKRVSGTSLGGGTYLGLCALLTRGNVTSFDLALELSTKGRAQALDMLVGDIYGGNYAKFGLPATLVASSFGKMVMKERPRENVTDADICRTLLLMITQSIGQIAAMTSQRCGTKKIYFVGNFLHENEISSNFLSHFINYWSKGDMEALFLEHDGYLDALGVLLQGDVLAAHRTSLGRGERMKVSVT